MNANRDGIAARHFGRRANGATTARDRDGIAPSQHRERRQRVEARPLREEIAARNLDASLHGALETDLERPERRAGLGHDGARMASRKTPVEPFHGDTQKAEPVGHRPA